MADSLDKKIQSWLVDQGYPLEMEMASIAKDIGFDVSQADYYIDPESKEPREIDLVISVNNFLGEFNLSYNLFVECKSGKEKPWLLLANQNEFDGKKESLKEIISHTSIYGSYIANNYARGVISRCYYADQMLNLFPEPTLGYGLTQAFTSGTDVPFKAMMSATKASLSHVERFGRALLSKPFVLAIPVVVTEAPLFSVVYNSESSEFETNEITQGTLLWKHMVSHRSRIGVFIVQRNNLKPFLNECKTSADWWSNLDTSYVEEIATEIESRGEK